MRRILYISMVLTLLFSCDSKDIIDHTPTPTPQPESSRPIEMSATTDWYGATKAPVTNVTEIETAGFVVWGVCIDSEDTENTENTEITETDIFGSAGTLVTHDDEKGWGYSPLKYWHEGTSKFMAITPAMEYTMTKLPYVSTPTGLTLSVTFPGEGFNLRDTQSDLMVAYSDETYDGKTLPGAVSMQFNHQLALVNIQFVKTDARSYKVTSLQLSGNSSNATSVEFTAVKTIDEVNPDKPVVQYTSTWRELTSSQTPYCSFTSEGGLEVKEVPTDCVSDLLVFSENTDIVISGTYIEGVNGNELRRDFSVPFEVNWQANKQYSYCFELSANGIVFGKIEVDPWPETAEPADGTIEM